MSEEKKFTDIPPESDAATCAKKNDLGKARWDLLPLHAIAKIVEIYTYGAAKYGPNNWQKLADFEDRYYAAMMRHLEAHRRGELYDKESGFLHVAHVGWGAIALIWKELQKEQTAIGIYCTLCHEKQTAAFKFGELEHVCLDCAKKIALTHFIEEACFNCQGTGLINGQRCVRCEGAGKYLVKPLNGRGVR